MHHLGVALPADPSIDAWIEALPHQLAGNGFRRLRDAIVSAHAGGRKVVAAMGGHVIKTGCAPYLIDWIDRGILSGVAMNGSAAIHDLELAISGRTSEDVGPRLMAGTFGFAGRRPTSSPPPATSRRKTDAGWVGRSGELVAEHGGPGLESSLLVAAHRRGIPLTVHVAVGTDIVHMTPRLDGAALGRATLDDFRGLCRTVAEMAGGVWLNLGSAVVLPEVFLKAVAIARNLGVSLDGLTTANLDFHQQYRGLLNVLQRPGAEGIALTGHHELMIPLLHAAVVARVGSDAPPGKHRPSSPHPADSHGPHIRTPR